MDKKYLIITGASSGIGLATAQLFAKNGWNIINISRRPCHINDAINISVDLSNSDSIEQISTMIHTIIDQQQLICIIHNACSYQSDTILSIMPEKLKAAFEVNIIAPLSINKLLFPLLGPGSSIIYVGSTLSEKAVPGAASYCISKHASVGMMRASCQDLAGTNIHTVCVCPGFTDTEMLKSHLKNDIRVIKSIESKICFNRLIKPDEIADLMLFAANSPVLNGSVLHANLGQIQY